MHDFRYALLGVSVALAVILVVTTYLVLWRFALKQSSKQVETLKRAAKSGAVGYGIWFLLTAFVVYLLTRFAIPKPFANAPLSY